MSKAQAIQALKQENDFAFIQTWDIDGVWHRVKFSEKKASKIEHAARHGKG